MNTLKVLDLFSGIGGFSLGLESTGYFKTIGFCEIEPYCRAILKKHWPMIHCFEDIRELTGAHIIDLVGKPDLICGGFPCQDISVAGKGKGIEGSKSGLWKEYYRLICEIRPAFVLIENVPAIRIRGADKVLTDLETAKYSCEPFVVGAIHTKAPHRRQRARFMAYANEQRLQSTTCPEFGSIQKKIKIPPSRQFSGGMSTERNHWRIEPDVGRVAHGVPARVDRLKALGNAVVPQIVASIGTAFIAVLETYEE